MLSFAAAVVGLDLDNGVVLSDTVDSVSVTLSKPVQPHQSQAGDDPARISMSGGFCLATWAPLAQHTDLDSLALSLSRRNMPLTLVELAGIEPASRILPLRLSEESQVVIPLRVAPADGTQHPRECRTLLIPCVS